MKKFLTLFFFSIILFSCRDNKEKGTIMEEETTNEKKIVMLWEADFNDSSGNMAMKKIESHNLDTLSPSSLIDYNNAGDSKTKLEFVKVSNDTIYLKIPDSEFLTQRMGTSGALAHLAYIVFNFTELPGINFVNLNFEEGDHASPGTYSRDSFNNK